ncbi:MAG: class I SAM-dependent methyltransferase [Bacteroidetes bacterium]|nr:class I SAM-dependent methyltransferase [Bacteroidota bacterium]
MPKPKTSSEEIGALIGDGTSVTPIDKAHAMERSSNSSHWDVIYGKYRHDQVGWYAPVLQTSLNWILKYSDSEKCAVLDVGGGSSTLVDDLLRHFYSNVTIVDLSQRALDETVYRLGAKAFEVNFNCADILDPNLFLMPVKIWHDRAAFHFMFEKEIDMYLQRLAKSLLPNAVFILGVFTKNAPPTCSGLRVNRHSMASLERIFSHSFLLLESKVETHITPNGVQQEYLYSAWRRLP